jgi:hypothetical protein
MQMLFFFQQARFGHMSADLNVKETSKAHGLERTALFFARTAFLVILLPLVAGVALQAAEAPRYGQSAPGFPFAISDFDGDNKPDFAKVQNGGTTASKTRYSIDFELSTGSRQSFVLTAPAGGLRLESRDINGDHFPDVVVTTSWTEEPVAVLLNDGRGNFKSLDASVFPDAFETSDSSLNRPARPEEDGAAVCPRTPPGESKESHFLRMARKDSGRAKSGSEQFPSLPDREGFFGRAPPPSLQ